MLHLHPVFHVSLLEPYCSPSNIPTTPNIVLNVDPTPQVDNFLDCHKIGHCYEYFMPWKGFPSSDNFWVPFSDLPTSLDESIEHFHHCHPCLPWPHHFNFICNHSNLTLASPLSDKPNNEQTLRSPSHSLSPMSQHHPIFHPTCSSSPPQPSHMTMYEPPSFTTMCSGRISQPPALWLDPQIPHGARSKKGGSVRAQTLGWLIKTTWDWACLRLTEV